MAMLNFFRRKQAEPTQMNVDLALFRGDDCLWRGTIRITNKGDSSEFTVNDDLILLISHEFALPACSLGIELRSARGANGMEQLLEAGLAMGVHDSSDWESIALDPEYTLGFLCRTARRNET